MDTSTNDLVPIRITEISDYQTDRRTWWYRWVLKLRQKGGNRESAPLVSGSAIHFGIEAGLLRQPGADPLTTALAAANLKLEAELGAGAEKYKPGVGRALSGVPQAVWTTTLPQTEMELRIPRPDLGVEFVGRPDVWFETEAGIEIYEFKTASADERIKYDRYTKWSMQTRFLAVLLDWQLRMRGLDTPPIYTAYVMLSTRGKHIFDRPRLVTRAQLEVFAEILEGYAVEMRETVLAGRLPLPSYSALMDWSEFREIEEARLLALPGLSADDVMNDDFERRPNYVPLGPTAEAD